MRDHHQRTMDKLIERYGEMPEFPALIIVGSLAQGTESEYSDVDAVLVATKEEFEKRRSSNDIVWHTTDVCDYPGGYVDGKIIDFDFLHAAAERGSEPTRFWFEKAFLAYSRISGLDDLLKRISAYPEHERNEKIMSFYAQMQAYRWYMGEAEKSSDRYLATLSATKLVFYGARLILAYNRVLFPFHKRLMAALDNAPDKPAEMLELVHALIAEPCKKNADLFCESILAFRRWEEPEGGWGNRWCKDIEWTWLEEKASLEDF